MYTVHTTADHPYHLALTLAVCNSAQPSNQHAYKQAQEFSQNKSSSLPPGNSRDLSPPCRSLANMLFYVTGQVTVQVSGLPSPFSSTGIDEWTRLVLSRCSDIRGLRYSQSLFALHHYVSQYPAIVHPRIQNPGKAAGMISFGARKPQYLHCWDKPSAIQNRKLVILCCSVLNCHWNCL